LAVSLTVSEILPVFRGQTHIFYLRLFNPKFENVFLVINR